MVFPAPFGPTIAVSVPGSNLQLTRSTATCPPKRMVRSRVSNVACAIDLSEKGRQSGRPRWLQRLFRIGIGSLSAGIVSTSSSRSLSSLPSFFTLKWYMACSAW